MSFFLWSGWIERLFIDGEATPARLALMAWVIAHSSLDGTPIDGPDDIAADVGLSAEEVEEALEYLIAHGFVEKVDRRSGQTRGLRAIFVR